MQPWWATKDFFQKH